MNAKTDPFPERELWGESVELRPDDGRIPEAVRELSPFLLSTSRAPFQIRKPSAIVYVQGLYGGDYWMLRFDSQGLQNPVVAVSRIVSDDMRLRAAPEPSVVSMADPFVRVARAHLPEHWLRAFASADLDGDGLEEVGWHEQDIESSARYVTHQSETGAAHRRLSAGGH